tara:strand:+ start:4925 stop:5059 length:135 start_codon:yes stop_codon:yes gene_type:complete
VKRRKKERKKSTVDYSGMEMVLFVRSEHVFFGFEDTLFFWFQTK